MRGLRTPPRRPVAQNAPEILCQRRPVTSQHRHQETERRALDCRSPELSAVASGTSLSETSSSHKVPEISKGKDRLRGRQTDILTSLVSAPVENVRLTLCQPVVPTVPSVDWSKASGWA